MLENYPPFIQYASYFILFVIGQSFSIWGQYVTLPYKDLSYWDALKMALPFAWINWFFMTFAINIGHQNDLVTPTQNIFLLIILQFTLVLIVNNFYLKQTIYRSDLIAFFILIIGYLVSFYHIISKLFHLPVPDHTHDTPIVKKPILKNNKVKNKNKNKKNVKFTEQ